MEVARLRRDNKVLLDDIADLRALYDVCLQDRDRLTTAPTDHRATTPPDQMATGTR